MIWTMQKCSLHSLKRQGGMFVYLAAKKSNVGPLDANGGYICDVGGLAKGGEMIIERYWAMPNMNTLEQK